MVTAIMEAPLDALEAFISPVSPFPVPSDMYNADALFTLYRGPHFTLRTLLTPLTSHVDPMACRLRPPRLRVATLWSTNWLARGV